MQCFRRTRGQLLFGAVALALVASACGSDNKSSSANTESSAISSDTQPKGKLVVGVAADPTSLDYQAASDPGTEFATWSINEGLLEFNDKGETVPLLAAEKPTMDQQDPTRWHVKLRSGVKFSNGVALDAAVVKANVDRIVDPAFASPLKSNISTLQGAEVIDPLSVDIITSKSDPDFDFRLTALRLVEPGAAALPGYAQSPVGTGPFVFKSWTKGDRIVLTANPDYWGDGPGVESVEIRTIPDLSTRVAALNSGEIQMASVLTADLAPTVPAVIKSTAPMEADVSRIALFKPPFDDVRFRQALNFAIDKETMRSKLYGDYAKVANCTIVPSASGAYTSGLKPYAFDPQKAKDLLAQVNLPAGFKLEFNGSTGLWAGSQANNEAMASYWRDIGLDVDLKINAPSVQLDLLNHGGLGSQGGNPETPGLAYTSAGASTMHASRQVGLYIDRNGYASAIGSAYPELDGLVTTAFSSLDNKARQGAYDALAKEACDQAFFIFGLERYDIWGASKDVKYAPVAGPLRRFNLGRVTLGS